MLQIFSPRFSFLTVKLFLLLILLYGCSAQTAIAPHDRTPKTAAYLHELVYDPSPWMNMPAYSEQAPPFYVGATPREIELGLSQTKSKAEIPADLKSLGEKQLDLIHAGLVRKGYIRTGEEIETEGWLTTDDAGRWTWALARWRPGISPSAGRENDQQWKWIDAGILAAEMPEIPPVLPLSLKTSEKGEYALIFSDFLKLPGLYDKPAFGNCLWSMEGENAELPMSTQAWLPPSRMGEIKENGAPAPVCRAINQPMRFNGRPVTWRIRTTGSRTIWPDDICWQTKDERAVLKNAVSSGIKWPRDFREAYRQDVLTLDGEAEAVFPISKRRIVFKRKNSADPQNQLSLLVEYLEERYHALGLKTFRQEFLWRGIPQINLVAVIAGSDPEKNSRPVLMADHIDTAYCEDIYAANGQRISAPGADDNVSATAALLRAAEILKNSRPRRDIWLTHFTGEEYPADCMGARMFVGRLLRQKTDITGLVLMDMIGWREKGDKVFQISAGGSPASEEMAAVAIDASRSITAEDHPSLKPVLRLRRDEKSYLYNTDGLPFSDAGYPVILFNEHINRLHNLNRIGYHHTLDASGLMDFDYAAAIARTAIETTARLAGAFDYSLQ